MHRLYFGPVFENRFTPLHICGGFFLRHFEVNVVFKLWIWLPSGYCYHLVTVRLWCMITLVQVSAAVKKTQQSKRQTGDCWERDKDLTMYFFSHCTTQEYTTF